MFKDNLRKSYRKYSNFQIKVPQREIEQIAERNQLNSSRNFPRNEEYEFLNYKSPLSTQDNGEKQTKQKQIPGRAHEHEILKY